MNCISAPDVPMDRRIRSAEGTGLSSMQKCSNRQLMQFMGLDYSDYDSYIYYKSREALGAGGSGCPRYRRDDLTAVEDAIDRRVADQTRTFEGYGPSQVAMLKNAIIYKRGNYIFYCVDKILTGMRRCSVMLFSSIVFIFCFLPILLAVYFLVPKKYLFARNIVLLLFSLVFYSWGEPVYVFLMIYSAFFIISWRI
ncbi:DUF4358 domain-containing protein [Hornefia porci]|uniref:DUF4358 domain-containing protein n=1 Tax=Hornefia porci TaxID=2652292 RepID=UPI0031833C73